MEMNLNIDSYILGLISNLSFEFENELFLVGKK